MIIKEVCTPEFTMTTEVLPQGITCNICSKSIGIEVEESFIFRGKPQENVELIASIEAKAKNKMLQKLIAAANLANARAKATELLIIELSRELISEKRP